MPHRSSLLQSPQDLGARERESDVFVHIEMMRPSMREHRARSTAWGGGGGRGRVDKGSRCKGCKAAVRCMHARHRTMKQQNKAFDVGISVRTNDHDLAHSALHHRRPLHNRARRQTPPGRASDTDGSTVQHHSLSSSRLTVCDCVDTDENSSAGPPSTRPLFVRPRQHAPPLLVPFHVAFTLAYAPL